MNMIRAKWDFQGFGNVFVTAGKISQGYHFGASGGLWALNKDGALGSQLVGTCDVKAPRKNQMKFESFARSYLKDRIDEMKHESLFAA